MTATRRLEPVGSDASRPLQSLLDRGPGVVCLDPGEYTCAGLRIPDGVILTGQGPSTVLRLGDGPVVIDQEATGNWAVRDLVVEGAATGKWEALTDRGQSGIRAHRCWGYEISGVTVRRFEGAGIQIAHTALGNGHAPFCNGGNLDRVSAHGCYAGVRFDERGEYLNATAISAWHNVIGLVIHAGNVKVAASNICSNVDGVFIEDKANGSHGALGNCLINHNQRHALWCRAVRVGMSIQNCCFFYGDILIEDSEGVVIGGGEICCDLAVRGPKVNRIAGNFVIPHEEICHRFDIAPHTLMSGNFTATGPWTPTS